jgi:hypothetical protein
MEFKMIKSASSLQAQNRTLDEYAKEIAIYRNDKELMEQSSRLLSMYDIFVDASEHFSSSEIEEICRDIQFSPQAFDRFVRIGKIHQERQKNGPDPLPFIWRAVDNLNPNDVAAALTGNQNPKEEALAVIEGKLQPLVSAYLKDIVQKSPPLYIFEQTLQAKQFNFGICLAEVQRLDKRHLKVCFAIDTTLCESLPTDVPSTARLSFLIETYFSYSSASLSEVSHVDEACGKVTIDDKSRNEILEASSLQELRTVAESIGPVVTRLALEGNAVRSFSD